MTVFFFFSSRRRHTRSLCDWSSDVCSSDLQENPALTEDLLQELPGILLWALQGLDRLNQRAHFTEPATSRDAVVALADLASPVAAFVREACERGPEREVPARQLYEAWRVWSKDHGRDRPTTEQRFGRDLRAAVPGLKVVRPADNSGPRPRQIG